MLWLLIFSFVLYFYSPLNLFSTVVVAAIIRPCIVATCVVVVYIAARCHIESIENWSACVCVRERDEVTCRPTVQVIWSPLWSWSFDQETTKKNQMYWNRIFLRGYSLPFQSIGAASKLYRRVCLRGSGEKSAPKRKSRCQHRWMLFSLE